MATTVFPAQGDAITEAAWQGLNDAIAAESHGVVSGFDLSGVGAGSVSAAAGTALVSGYAVVTDGAITKALSDGTRYVWLTSSGTLAESADDTPPNGDDLFLGHVLVAAGAITNIYASYFQQNSTGTQLWFGRRPMNHNTSMIANVTDANLAPITLPPGLWFVQGFMMIVGDANAGTDSSTINVTAPSGATVSNYRVAIMPGNTPSDAAWRTTTATSSLTTASDNDVCPVRWYGLFDLPDGGTIAWTILTNPFHTLSRGYHSALRIS
jgi:hypothetical protein